MRKKKRTRVKEGYSRAQDAAKDVKAKVSSDSGVSSASKRGGTGKRKAISARGKRMMQVMRNKGRGKAVAS